jgi:hypothetical protein
MPDDKFIRWPSVRFTPFEGGSYEQGFGDGLKLLVLGESHYGDDVGTEMTRYWLCKHIASEYIGTFSKLEKLLSYCLPHSFETSVWRKVAFANFIHVSLQDNSCQRDESHWTTGRTAFPGLLDALKPDVILALGRETWKNLPWDDYTLPHQGHHGLRTGDDNWGVIYRRPDGGRTVAGWIYHPAARPWSGNLVSPCR